MKKLPLVSVIMPVFNAQKYVASAIRSILNQKYKNFELIIIDDHSIDGSLQILNKFKDHRIRVIKNKQNVGVTKSLNKGFKLANGEFIARMDADDISLPTRLERQITFIQRHPDVGVIGTNIEIINESGKLLLNKKTNFQENVYSALAFSNPILHPTVFMRKNIIKKYGGYDETLNGAEDYDLWLRLSRYTKVVNLPEVLLHYRLHIQGVSYKDIERIQTAFLKTQIKSVFAYHYPAWRLVFTFKPLFARLVPSLFKRWIYRNIYGYI